MTMLIASCQCNEPLVDSDDEFFSYLEQMDSDICY